VELFVEYYFRGFIKYLICLQNILHTDKSAIICMIFGLNKNTIQYHMITSRPCQMMIQDVKSYVPAIVTSPQNVIKHSV